MRKLGFIGGSFDPIHFGHLCAANDALENGSLDNIIFVPTAQAPLKDKATQASAEQRIEMLQLAIERNPHFSLSLIEISRGGVSYTIDTVDALEIAFPKDQLHWIIGADQAINLPQWHRIHELSRRINFLVLERPGYLLDRCYLTHPEIFARVQTCKGHQLQISSTEIRSRAQQGKSLECFLPQRVNDYITHNRLYR